MADINIHVAIPSYNNVEGLKRLLPQVLIQQFASVTVLDDGSTDDTETLVRSFDAVRYIKADMNAGTVAAKNLILRDLPPTGFILFVDSDMEIVTEEIPRRLHDFLESHPRTGAGVGPPAAPRPGGPCRC